MANVRNEARPLSPHLSIWKWGPGMTVSIIHRATGTGMATLGTILFVWWLTATATGPAAYASFTSWFTGTWAPLGYVIGVGLSWAFFQHMASGVRHLFLDQGANFELKGNKTSAVVTFAFSVLATVAFWVWILEKSNG